ncbi:hypothetical protein MKJ01_16180 [Chryseobacterium sp. SSA4.19]|uniref:hypothetical protein n=1 Tax=Chryseobacterium sp. SSA4.19 TaxID=2919915 RepID=UPI001F4EC314|nr:hypothetical protein [Chryseobacterium sp. SSA4.19]MCJ8155304.1 hypothetical protein [Chryseobacterium sp. SSA4.19]
MKRIYNIKILASSFFLVAAVFIHGQETSNLTNNAGGNTELPNVNPPSPESFFRTKFGNLEAGEFRGTPNIEIPVHTVSTGGLAHAISLRYAKSGVKVNDIPNSVGMNWILEAGGVINRTIYDIRDEEASQRLLLTQSDMNYLHSPAGAQTLGTYAHDIVGMIDNETDIFNFSMPGYSGSFYLDANFNPVIMSQNHNLKIETIGNFKDTYQFLITTFDGTKYFFGGSGYTENTFVRQNGLMGGVTGFYLSKIEDGRNNKIEFEYFQQNSRSVSFGKSETKSAGAYISQNGTSLSATPPSTTINLMNVHYSKYISKIKTSDEQISFNYLTDANEIFQKLGDITISKNGINIKKYVFDYINNNTTVKSEKRFFLESVKEYTIKGIQEVLTGNNYTLTYDSPLEMPVRLANGIDYLGYYNGKDNSYTLLPNLNLFYGLQEDNFFSQQQNQNYLYYADRRPNFEFAKKGTLTSITYPTKGKTVFEYEPVFAKKAAYTEQNILIGEAASAVGYEEFANPSCIPVSYDCYTTLSSSDMVADHKMYITLKLHTDTNWGGTRAKAVFDIIDNSTHQVVFTKMIMIPKINLENTLYDMAFSTDFTAQPGKNYQLKFRIADNICSQCFGTATVKYQNGWEKVDDGGIRLKKQYDIADNTITNIKRYYYDMYSDIHNIEKLLPPFQPYFFTNHFTQMGDFGGPAFLEVATKFELMLHSDPKPMPLYIEDPVYPNVTISHGGDNFEKGGEEKTFDSENGYEYRGISTFWEPTYNGAYLPDPSVMTGLTATAAQSMVRNLTVSNINGHLISHKILVNKNNTIYLKSDKSNIYSTPLEKVIYNLMGMKLYNYFYVPSGVNENTSLDNMYIGQHAIPTFASFLDSTVTKEYMEDVPVNTLDDSPYKKIVTTTEYTYGNPEKQLSKKNTVFPDQAVMITTYSYAHEKNNQLMIDRNMVGIPLETTTTQTKEGVTKTLGKRVVVYPDQNNYPTSQAGSLLLPLSVTSSDQLTGVMSTDVSYDKYDQKGNILQYTTKDGIPVTIVWGYNNTQPIARVEGITYDQLTSLASPTAIITASDNDAADPSKEGLLLVALNTFRKNSQLTGMKITTYTYDPLIGVTSITPPSGIRQVFTYDAANRLKENKVRSKDTTGAYTDKKAAEYKYNYKP